MISVTTLDELSTVVDSYLAHPAYVFDVETVPLDPAYTKRRGDVLRNKVTWLSLATEGRADVIPFGHPNGSFLKTEIPLNAAGLKVLQDNRERAQDGRKPRVFNDKYHRTTDPKKFIDHFTPPPPHLTWETPGVRQILEPLFFGDQIKIGHNVRFDLKSIAKHFGGRIPSPPYGDTAIAGFLLDSQLRGRLDLASCVERELGYTMVKGVGKCVEIHSFADVERYGFLDARYDWLLYKTYMEQIAADGLTNVWRLEMDVVEAVVNMEMTGAPVKVDRLRDLDTYLRDRVDEVTGALYAANGVPFNIDSNIELSTVLFTPKKEGGQGLHPKILTDGGKKKEAAGEPLLYRDYSTSEKALKKLSGTRKVVDDVILYGDLKKLHSGFVVPYLGGEVTTTVNGKSKIEQRESLLIEDRIYATFRPDGAVTGRFSSKDPNLQQVPSRSEDGLKVRSCFSVEDLDGQVIIQADYSQIEPRVLTDLCREPKLVRVYLEGGDIYTTLASPFGLDRNAGKVLFLSAIYGTGPDTLANACGLTITQAKEIIYDQFPGEFPKVYTYKKKIVTEARRRKPAHARTLLGRRVYLPDLQSRTDWKRRRAERQAFNGLIQGTAADINKIGLVHCDRAIRPLGGHIFATIHDEVLAVAPKDRAEEIAALVQQALEGATMLKLIPLIAETKIVSNWAEAKS